MVRRGPNEAIGDQIDEGVGQPAGFERNLDNVCRGRLNLGDCQHAHRDKRAIRAAFVLLSVWTARHVAGHGRHIAHLANGELSCCRRRNQRRNNQSNDHKDREQMTDESAKIHALTSHEKRNYGRPTSNHSLEISGLLINSQFSSLRLNSPTLRR